MRRHTRSLIQCYTKKQYSNNHLQGYTEVSEDSPKKHHVGSRLIQFGLFGLIGYGLYYSYAFGKYVHGFRNVAQSDKDAKWFFRQRKRRIERISMSLLGEFDSKMMVKCFAMYPELRDEIMDVIQHVAEEMDVRSPSNLSEFKKFGLGLRHLLSHVEGEQYERLDGLLKLMNEPERLGKKPSPSQSLEGVKELAWWEPIMFALPVLIITQRYRHHWRVLSAFLMYEYAHTQYNEYDYPLPVHNQVVLDTLPEEKLKRVNRVNIKAIAKDLQVSEELHPRLLLGEVSYVFYWVQTMKPYYPLVPVIASFGNIVPAVACYLYLKTRIATMDPL